MLATNLPAVPIQLERPVTVPGQLLTLLLALQCTWPHGTGLAGANKVLGHSATILSYGQTIYLALPYSIL